MFVHFLLLIGSNFPGHYLAKLDKHSYNGIFLGYEGLSRNNIMEDVAHSGHVKVGGNFSFDDAHCTSTLFIHLVHSSCLTLVFIHHLLFILLALLLSFLHLLHPFTIRRYLCCEPITCNYFYPFITI